VSSELQDKEDKGMCVSRHREWLIILWAYLTLKITLALCLACIALALTLLFVLT